MKVTKYQRPKGMPRDYLKKITESLANEGVITTSSRVRDILRGKTVDVELTIHIKQIVKEISKNHLSHLKRLRSIQKSLKKR